MLEEHLRQTEEGRATKIVKMLLDADLRPDTNVQQLQKKLARVKHEVDNQEQWTSTEIKSICANTNTMDALVVELRRTLTTTRTESEDLHIRVDTLCARLATECNTTEQLRVDSAQRASNVEACAELTTERAAVADHKKEVFVLAS